MKDFDIAINCLQQLQQSQYGKVELQQRLATEYDVSISTIKLWKSNMKKYGTPFPGQLKKLSGSEQRQIDHLMPPVHVEILLDLLFQRPFAYQAEMISHIEEHTGTRYSKYAIRRILKLLNITRKVTLCINLR